MALDGYLVAGRACPAYQSFRTLTNPGEIQTEISRAYRIVGINQAGGTFYSVVVPGAEPERRWVAVSCGERVEQAAAAPQPAPQPKPQAPKPVSNARYALAVSWQPAFCELGTNRRECRSQTVRRFDATHFSLHGLWPQPRDNEYCRVGAAERDASLNGRWRDLAPVSVSRGLRAELEKVMPGTQSFLDRHEWTRHGTCYGKDQEGYFADSLKLMSALNASSIVALFADNVGRELTQRQIRAAFDRAFGPGAGRRVEISCIRDGNRTLIDELTISLRGEITATASLADLILAASPTDGGCPAGIVDPVGNQ